MRLTYIFICLFLYLFLNSGFCGENDKTKVYEKVLFDGDSVQLFKEVYYEKKERPKDLPKNWSHFSEVKVSYITMTLEPKT
ncbi:MAG: hypothetical protein K8S87_02455, partial [Planctomycetes bacterium]|nr:hypothetical protein [Planctomycetota bacterium]